MSVPGSFKFVLETDSVGLGELEKQHLVGVMRPAP